jgi:hypothetical protein
MRFEVTTNGWRFNKHHIAQQFLRVLRDTDTDRAIGFNFDPFVGGGIFQIGWIAHVNLLKIFRSRDSWFIA